MPCEKHPAAVELPGSNFCRGAKDCKRWINICIFLIWLTHSCSHIWFLLTFFPLDLIRVSFLSHNMVYIKINNKSFKFKRRTWNNSWVNREITTAIIDSLENNQQWEYCMSNLCPCCSHRKCPCSEMHSETNNKNWKELMWEMQGVRKKYTYRKQEGFFSNIFFFLTETLDTLTNISLNPLTPSLW